MPRTPLSTHAIADTISVLRAHPMLSDSDHACCIAATVSSRVDMAKRGWQNQSEHVLHLYPTSDKCLMLPFSTLSVHTLHWKGRAVQIIILCFFVIKIADVYRPIYIKISVIQSWKSLQRSGSQFEKLIAWKRPFFSKVAREKTFRVASSWRSVVL